MLNIKLLRALRLFAFVKFFCLRKEEKLFNEVTLSSIIFVEKCEKLRVHGINDLDINLFRTIKVFVG
jgi:hypothetical protein